MRLTGERSWAKMAAGSDLLDDVFFNTEVDEKVVSDLVGSLESELTGARHVNAAANVPPATNHVGNSAVGSRSNEHGSKMGLSQQELAKAGVQGGVINSTGSRGVDGAAGNTSSMTAAQSQSKPGAAGGVVTVVSGVGKPGTVGVQTLNGSAVVMNCHIINNNNNNNSSSSSSSSSQPAVTLINNGPVSASKGSATVLTATPSAIVRNSPTSAPNAAVVSSVKTVPTVTLVRPPMQTPPTVGVTGAVGSLVHKPECAKTITHVVAASSARSPTVLQNLRTSVPSPVAAAAAAATPPGGIRAIAPQVLAPRLAQPQQGAPNIQNIQLPPGMVLVRSESGQLLVIHQQTLAQMQAQSQSQSAMTPRPAAPTSTPPVQITSHQAPGASLLTRPVTPTTIIKQGSTVQTTVTATTTLQRPPVLQNTIMLGGTATAPGQPLGTPAPVQPGSAVTQRVAGTHVAPTAVSAETLENVKKCRNFLSTLIKLASGGKQSSETAANVKELVKNLLEAKIDPEDFTSRLYRELNSSPQPYLVPFLKRSLPALRQMTPDPEAFIQQSLLPLPSTTAAAASTALTAVMQRPPLSTTPAAPAASAAATKTTVISVTQTPHGKQIVPQQQVVRPQVTLAQSPMVTLRGQSHSRIIVGHPQVVKQLPTAMKQTLAPGARGVQVVSQVQYAAAQRNKLKEAGGAAFRDDDDINDVASMAGVNLSEESARILATNSVLVGTVTRSCKDEAFLATSLLTRRALEIGKKFGVGELGADVINFISHAAQQRLQSLLEKVSQVALQKNTAFKEDVRCEQVSDVRTQLRFFEQLDQMEKQRKEEQEREILLKAAKSRSRQEDPEQLRLKQKAKEMQQQELAQIRQREANLTALAAIGPRKKRKMDSPVRGASAEGSGSGPSQPGGSGAAGSRQPMRQRITRVNLKDLLFCLENERETSHSQLLYKGFLK
ncbi:transcription initiation factor TFIID subunit 4-like isoform X2 [Cyclopterus lumpus]|uniref:transcription initiation factor TFIID subunit 4-like isoform X2 n=1 Tax=Cyclopterus lumpus TaxID=8103 RepID=UPI0014861F1B|nr:transcription initiation factor TFIID subunit 4-like isoform X2 [Cyclopterus lumpus]